MSNRVFYQERHIGQRFKIGLQLEDSPPPELRHLSPESWYTYQQKVLGVYTDRLRKEMELATARDLLELRQPAPGFVAWNVARQSPPRGETATGPGSNGSDPAGKPEADTTNQDQAQSGFHQYDRAQYPSVTLDTVGLLDRQAEAAARAGNRTESNRLAAMARAIRYAYDQLYSQSSNKGVPRDDGEPDEPDPFPIDALTPLQREMVLRIAESIGVHPNLPAICALGAVAAAIGRGLYAPSGPNQIIYGNLFLIGSAISGEGKTESARPIIAPFLRVHHSKIRTFKHGQYPAACSRKRIALKQLSIIESQLSKRSQPALSKEEKKKLRDQHEDLMREILALDDEMTEPAMLTEDCTQEKMALLLQQNREQLFAYSTDAGKALNNLEGLYNRLKTPEDNLMVHAFSVEGFTVHRINRSSINLEHPCLSLLWLLQPARFDPMFANKLLRDAGFLARVLPGDTRLEPIGKDPNRRAIPTDLQARYDQLIQSLIAVYWDNRKDSFKINVPLDGESLLVDYQNELVPLRKANRDLNSFIARWPEQARRVAIGLHAALLGDQAHLTPLAIGTIANAIRIVRWFSAEQLRILEFGSQKQLIDDCRALRSLLINRYDQGVTLRTLRNNHGKDQQFVERIVKEFPRVFQLKDYQPPGGAGGRPTKVLTLVQTP